MKIIWINNNNDMINCFFDKILDFIYKYEEDFKLITDNESFFNNLCDFLYNNYILNDYNSKIDYNKNFEYFDLKYCSNIVDLYIDCRDISEGFTNDIFNRKDNNSYNLLEFIYENIELLEDYEQIEDLEEEQNDLNEEYY